MNIIQIFMKKDNKTCNAIPQYQLERFMIQTRGQEHWNNKLIAVKVFVGMIVILSLGIQYMGL